jgi:hypothetical protein
MGRRCSSPSPLIRRPRTAKSLPVVVRAGVDLVVGVMVVVMAQ